MTVNAQTPYTIAVGNGVSTVFPFTFKILNESDLVVTVDGITTPGTAYSIDGLGVNSGGEVTFLIAPTTGAKVILERIVSLDRAEDYQYAGDLKAEVLNPDFDRVWMALQQVSEYVFRAIRLKKGSSIPPEIEPTANTVIGFDALKNLISIPIVIGTSLADIASSIGSSLVGFIQAGVGAVLRTLQDKARERISVKDFGATGDGVTDDVDAINAAVTYLVSRGGGILFFPKGTYLVSEHIKVRDYITYEGEGWSTVVKAMASSVDNVFGGYGPDYDFDIQSPVIQNMCIDGNNTGVAYNDALAPGADDAYQNVIRMHRWKNAIIQNCLIRNAVFNGISCYHGCHGSKIVNNYIANIGKSPDPAAGYYSYNGIFLEWYGDNIEISDNIITGTRQASIICQVADTGGMSKIGIRRNRCFLAQTEGIIVKDQSSGATGILDDFWIEDNYVQQSSLGGSTAAIRVERNSPGYFAFNFKIASNTIKDSSYIGLLVNTGAKSALLVDNTVYSSGNKGIIDAGEDTEITSCTSLNNVGANLDITSGTRTRVIGGQYLATGPNEGQRGTFTPTVLNGGAAVGRTYATQSGSYVVRGNRVEFNITIVMTAKGSSTGALTIGGLPFASKSSGAFGCPNINVANVTYTGIPFGLILNSSALINVYTQSSASTSTAMTDTALANNSEFYITGSYEV